MATVGAFISLSLDGCYSDANGDMSWAHSQDPEQAEFTAQNARGGSGLLFGRVTYDMLRSFWPTPQAAEMMPDVAASMNALPKFVASRTLNAADWSNTTVLGGDLANAVKQLKASGPDLTILGSGSIVTQLATAGLLDTLDVMLVPVSLGGGKRLFGGMPRSLGWRREDVCQFSNGNVFLRYRPG